MYINFHKLLIIVTFATHGLVSPLLAAQDRITGFLRGRYSHDSFSRSPDG